MMVETFCEECMVPVSANAKTVFETVSIRGTDLTVESEYPICPHCGARIADPAFAESNLSRAYDAYRKIEGIPMPDDLRSIRDAAGWSQRQLALLLGIGIASLQRYENGSLPTASHAALLKRLKDPGFLRGRLREIETTLSERDRTDLSCGIDKVFGSGWGTDAYRNAVMGFAPTTSSRFTGNVAFSEAKLREVIVYFAQNVRDLYKTKLNKVLFYLDFSMQRDFGRGCTGLRYARATFGPVPDGYEAWMPVFVDGMSLEYEERETGGQVVRPLRAARMEGFSADETAQLAAVAAFANGFPTASALSEASHKEDAWRNTPQGALIDYRYASTLKGVC